jgi:RNA polymerase sigma-70 factor (ECF subfamily)
MVVGQRGPRMDDRTREVTRLWSLAQPAVSAFVASMVRDIHARDDVMQDVAVAVLDSSGAYDPSRPFVAWAIGVARNQVRLHLRRRGRDRLVLDEVALDSLERAFAEIRPRDVRMLDHLEGCVDSLEGRLRRLCDLRYTGDLKPSAIAPRVGMSANGVAKALQRIRALLRACVERKAALDGL